MRFASAAHSLVGTPYRLYGRDPSTGLDCVGFVLAALRLAGRVPVEIPTYGLRNACIERHLALARRNGFSPIAGDLLLTRSGCAQHHLIVSLGSAGFAHAHAGVRKIVCEEKLLDFPVTAHWRLTDLD